MKQLVFYFVVGISFCLAYSYSLGQTLNNTSNYNLTDEELSEFRSQYIMQLNQNNTTSVLRRKSPFSTITPNQYSTAQDLKTDNLQLKTAEPGYIPFTVAPAGSALAGLNTEQWMGGIPMRLGDSNLLVYPNDPTNGMLRSFSGMFLHPSYGLSPIWMNRSSYTSPMFNQFGVSPMFFRVIR